MPITKTKATKPAAKTSTKFKSGKTGNQKPPAKAGKMSDGQEDDKKEEMAEGESDETEMAEDDQVEEPTEVESECDCVGEEGCECDDQEAADETADDTETAMESDGEAGKQGCGSDPEKMTPKQRQSLGKKFLTEFGGKGGTYFAQGLTLDQARVKFNAELKKENEALRKKVGDQEAQLTAFRGEEEPASFSTAEEKTGKPGKSKGSKFSHLSDGVSKFAASLKLAK